MHEGLSAPSFVRPSDMPPVSRTGDHGGFGAILFRRLLDKTAFASPIDFIDYSIIPAGSSIGQHEHRQTEELYFIVAGTPLVILEGERRRLSSGDLHIVRSGQRHELTNDTAEPVEILVVQVSV